jgi:hypothetical protein
MLTIKSPGDSTLLSYTVNAQLHASLHKTHFHSSLQQIFCVIFRRGRITLELEAFRSSLKMSERAGILSNDDCSCAQTTASLFLSNIRSNRGNWDEV